MEGLRVLLTCAKTEGSGDSTKTKTVYEDERLVVEPMRDETTGATAVPLLFAIPNDCLESTASDTKGIEWKLTVTARTPGVDYKSEFEVPIFRTPESREDFELDPKLAGEYSAPPSGEFLFAQAGIFKEPLPSGGVRFVFPAGRHLGTAIFLSVFLAIWFSAVVFMGNHGAPTFMTYLFAGVGILIALVAIDGVLYRSVVEADANELSCRGGWLGLGRRRAFAKREIARIESNEQMSSAKETGRRVVLVTTKGRKVKLAKSLLGSVLTNAIVKDLRAAVELDRNAKP
jgi:hypothetical protein